jgi:hypothetical protein
MISWKGFGRKRNLDNFWTLIIHAHSGRFTFYERKTDESRTKNLTYNPIKQQNIERPHLRWRDQQTLQEDVTDQA